MEQVESSSAVPSPLPSYIFADFTTFFSATISLLVHRISTGLVSPLCRYPCHGESFVSVCTSARATTRLLSAIWSFFPSKPSVLVWLSTSFNFSAFSITPITAFAYYFFPLSPHASCTFAGSLSVWKLFSPRLKPDFPSLTLVAFGSWSVAHTCFFLASWAFLIFLSCGVYFSLTGGQNVYHVASRCGIC